VPIECSVEFERVGQERFHALDNLVMRSAFDIHNALGRFCHEKVYQEELAQRCRENGFTVDREVLVRASHEGFSKPYYMDLLIERGVVYELKAVESLDRAHERQVINYLLLSDVSHGKLVNFRPASVEWRFVSTRLRRQDRTDTIWIDSEWRGDDGMSELLCEVLRSLLADWGAFLDAGLYREAILYHLVGPETGVREVDIKMRGRVIGLQRQCMLNAETAWHLSSVRRHVHSYEKHLVRLLRHTPLERMQWVNLDHRTVTLKTLER
jgi:GxxExxY protein